MSKLELLYQSIIVVIVFVFAGQLVFSQYPLSFISFPLFAGILGVLQLLLGFFVFHKGLGLGFALSGATNLLHCLPPRITYGYFLPIFSSNFPVYFSVMCLVGYFWYKKHQTCCLK